MRALVTSFVVLTLLGCGSDSTGPVDDGLYHPEASGVSVAEDAACQTLYDALSSANGKLACVATSRPCPDLVRVQAGGSCLSYDQGTVSGCAAYYAEQTDCDALAAAVSACVLVTTGEDGCTN